MADLCGCDVQIRINSYMAKEGEKNPEITFCSGRVGGGRMVFCILSHVLKHSNTPSRSSKLVTAAMNFFSFFC